MIDTENFDEDQVKWLDEALTSSKAEWKIVCGHRPIYSHGGHGDTPQLKEVLLPLLKKRTSLYMSGHDHNLEFIEKEDAPRFVVSGASSDVRPVGKGKHTLFSAAQYGFGYLSIGKSLEFRFIDSEGNELFKKVIRAKKKKKG